MSNITQYFLSKTSLLCAVPEEVKTPPGYEMFNTGGVEVEVAEFLYALVRLIKPNVILETGTHLGVSSTYMAQGCKDNNKGVVYTYEVIPELLKQAQALWTDIDVSHFINASLTPSLKVMVTAKIDLLFLDSEPQFRFDEFIKFWPHLSNNAIIIIHDLSGSMGLHDATYHGVYSWPYGDFRPKLGSFIKKNLVQVFHINSPRGLTLFQKSDQNAESIKLLKK